MKYNYNKYNNFFWFKISTKKIDFFSKKTKKNEIFNNSTFIDILDNVLLYRIYYT